MENVVSIKGGKADSRVFNYYLNSKATAVKLKQAAKNPDIVVVDNHESKNVQFSTGSYLATVVPLVRAWKRLEGDYIDEDEVDGMKIKVIGVENTLDQAGKIAAYLIRLMVEDHPVTIHCYDTKLSMLIQARVVLEDYCSRALVPYVEEQCREYTTQIKDINNRALTVGVENTTTRNQYRKFLHDGPANPKTPRLRTLSAPSTPVSVPEGVLALPPLLLRRS